LKQRKTILVAGTALLAPFMAFSEPAWPADFAAQESARRAAAAASSSSGDVTLASYDTRMWLDCVLSGLGTVAAPFDTRTFTQESAACAWLKTKPLVGLLLLFR